MKGTSTELSKMEEKCCNLSLVVVDKALTKGFLHWKGSSLSKGVIVAKIVGQSRLPMSSLHFLLRMDNCNCNGNSKGPSSKESSKDSNASAGQQSLTCSCKFEVVSEKCSF